VGSALLAGVSGDGLLVEKRELGLVLGAAVGGGFVVAEHAEGFLGLAAGGEGPSGFSLASEEPVELACGLGFGPAEVVEEAGAAAEGGGVERASRRGGARLGAALAGGGEAFLLLPALPHGAAERALGLFRLVVAEVENSLQG
jgi:hypothetical protein